MEGTDEFVKTSSYNFARWLFIRLLAVIYFIAFVSLWTQITGLIGDQGILPVQDFLRLVRQNFDVERYRLLPSVFWLNATNTSLHLVCGAGALFSCCLFFGWMSTPALFLLWLLYLSLTAVCREFLSFQWDVLLIETGFLAIFLNPPQFRFRDPKNSPYRKEILWLFWWLLFRLLFSSGVVKLTSGDPAWKDLTAMQYHYETQPLPTWIGWYVHQLPRWFDVITTALMFVIELGFCFLLFLPRKWRLIGSCGIAMLQLVILLTGNYCFFNLLTIALCLLAVDDRFWPARWLKTAPSENTKQRSWPRWFVVPLSIFLALLSFIPLIGSFRMGINWPEPLLKTYGFTQSFFLVNRYGLFAVMTKTRFEIILEGSNDRSDWKAYEFKYKPGDPERRPAFVEPHQPRLDWQMWFAALETYQSNRWFISFCYRLLEGSQPVLSLLAKNPFPENPPLYLRASLYEYRFADFAMKEKHQTWWRREFKGEYCPVLSLERE
ncbi:lipase maturation factor family protein [bacterium]|nr:lipase maturation factor family protein [bacterium]